MPGRPVRFALPLLLLLGSGPALAQVDPEVAPGAATPSPGSEARTSTLPWDGLFVMADATAKADLVYFWPHVGLGAKLGGALTLGGRPGGRAFALGVRLQGGSYEQLDAGGFVSAMPVVGAIYPNWGRVLPYFLCGLGVETMPGYSLVGGTVSCLGGASLGGVDLGGGAETGIVGRAISVALGVHLGVAYFD